MSDILDKYNVSRETKEKLKTYESLVLEWTDRFNLISKKSKEDIWERHILDSAQLLPLLNNNAKTLVDFGSGAGFPAIVLSILAQQFLPDLNIILIESIGKKASFLNLVKDELNLNITVYNERIENIKNIKADIITSRALASLPKLLNYAENFCNKNTQLIFPKGKTWQEELNNTKEQWIFDYQTIQSLFDKESQILYIKNIRRKR